MNKATFVNEIPSKIEGNEVPTLNLVKSMLTSENISDRISEFIPETTPEKYVFKTQENSISTIQTDDYQTKDLSKRYELMYNWGSSFKFTINGESKSDFGVIDKFEIKNRNPRIALVFHEPLTKNTEIQVEINDEGNITNEVVYAEIIPEQIKTDINQNQVMSSQCVSGYVSSAELTSNQISDRIQEYTTRKIGGEVIEYTINGKNSQQLDFCKINESWGPFTCNVLVFDSKIYTNNTVSLKYGTQSKEINSEGDYEDFGDFTIFPRNTTFVLAPRTYHLSNGDYTITIEFETQGPLEIVAKVRNTKEITTMNEDQLMTANAVRGYVQEKLAALESRITALEGKT